LKGWGALEYVQVLRAMQERFEDRGWTEDFISIKNREEAEDFIAPARETEDFISIKE
jgi:hypothetical protein